MLSTNRSSKIRVLKTVAFLYIYRWKSFACSTFCALLILENPNKIVKIINRAIRLGGHLTVHNQNIKYKSSHTSHYMIKRDAEDAPVMRVAIKSR